MTCRTTSSAKWTTMIIQYRHRWNIYLKNTKASCQVDDLNAPIPDVVLSEQHKRVIVKNWKKNLQRTTPRARTSPKWPVCFVSRARDAKPQRSVYSTWTPALDTCIPARKRSQRANWTQLGLQLANFSSESVLFDWRTCNVNTAVGIDALRSGVQFSPVAGFAAEYNLRRSQSRTGRSKYRAKRSIAGKNDCATTYSVSGGTWNLHAVVQELEGPVERPGRPRIANLPADIRS